MPLLELTPLTVGYHMIDLNAFFIFIICLCLYLIKDVYNNTWPLLKNFFFRRFSLPALTVKTL